MKASLTVWYAILCIVLPASGQQTSTNLASVGFGHASKADLRELITPTRAAASAAQFLRAFSKPSSMFRAELAMVADQWTWWLSSVRAPDYSIRVDARTGVVQSFMDYTITARQLKEPYNDSFSRRPKAVILSRLTSVAKKIGLPSRAYLKTFRVVAPDTPGVADANRAGQINASWSNKPYGYPFLREGAHGNSLGISLNPADGELLSFGQRWDVKIGGHKVAISAKRAWGQVPEQLKASDYRLLRIAYVMPTYAHGFPRPRRHNSWVAQLAYVFIAGKKVVYIDAGTGEYLGGLESTSILKIEGTL